MIDSPEELHLLDTNILVYAYHQDSPFYKIASDLREKTKVGVIKACITPQILAEFYSTVTNPKKFTRPATTKEASTEIEKYLNTELISKIFIKETTIYRMVGLAYRHKIKGPNIFDVLLVATILDNGINKIITANEQDFRKFGELEVINPFRD